MDPLDFLTFAETIAKNGKAGARSAASRAYYGAFHFAIEILSELDCDFQGNRNHGSVLNVVQNVDDAKVKSASCKLGDLQGYRVRADYRLLDASAETQKFAEMCIRLGEQVRQLLLATRADCKDESTKNRLKLSIIEYRNRTNQ